MNIHDAPKIPTRQIKGGFSKNHQLWTGVLSNSRIFHLQVNSHCASQIIDVCIPWWSYSFKFGVDGIFRKLTPIKYNYQVWIISEKSNKRSPFGTRILKKPTQCPFVDLKWKAINLPDSLMRPQKTEASQDWHEKDPSLHKGRGFRA